uniref:Uncharacterized protein n=1 Tax=Hubei odonate virus 15 TaxID=1922996 RepID=A0A1L3KP25_9VIRU|nr:hypothetical protein 4 [Hubei odonate virus 15]
MLSNVVASFQRNIVDVVTSDVNDMKFNVGTAIPVNPLSTGEMLLANTAYQTRNGVASLMSHAKLTSALLKEIVSSIRDLGCIVDILDKRSTALVDMIEDLVNVEKSENEALLCDLGSQALSAAATMCYTIPGIGTAFGAIFSYAGDLVDWYGDSIRSSRKLEQFAMRRTAFFDNMNTAQYSDSLGRKLRNFDDIESRMELVQDWLCKNEIDMYMNESWILGNSEASNGFNFYALIDKDKAVKKEMLGITYPVVQGRQGNMHWSVIDLNSDTMQKGILYNSECYRRDMINNLSHFMVGAKRYESIEKVSFTPIFIPDEMIESRVMEMGKVLAQFSKHHTTKLSQIHAYLQLGGKTI